MVGTLTTIRTDRKPVVLWTPWGAIPRPGFRGKPTSRNPLHNAIEQPSRRDKAAKGGAKSD